MRIAMPKGDIKWVRFIVKIPNGIKTEIEFTNIYFTVKKSSKDKNYLFQKSLKRENIYRIDAGDYQFKIDQEDTRELPVGEYKFDIQISYKNLLKETFVGDFVLKDEVTYYENEEGEDEEADFTLPMTSEKTAFILSIPDYHVIELTSPVNVNEEGNAESLTDIELDIITKTASSKDSALVLLQNGGEMFFSNDIEIEEQISIDRDIVIDFVNHKLSILEDGSLTVNGATVTMKNANIEAVKHAVQVINGGGLLMRGGNVTINNGVITSTGEAGSRGRIGDSNIYHSKSALIYHESANYPGRTGMKLVINGGRFVGVDASIEILSNEDTPNVAFYGGNYYPSLYQP